MRTNDQLDEIALIAAKEASSYTQFVNMVDGMYPGEAIRRIGFNPFTSDPNLEREDYFDSFLTSTWRFKSETSQYIAEQTSGANCLFVGSPSVYRLHSGPSILIDIDAADDRISTEFKRDFLQIDSSFMNMSFETIVFDPPWSLGHYLSWLQKSFGLLKPGGRLIFPLYKRYTKPTASADRVKVLTLLQQNGFSTEIVESVVRYETPSFEMIMLSRLRLPTVDWKRADLVVATQRKIASARPALPPFRPDEVKVLRYADGLIELRLVDDEALPALPATFSVEMVSPSSRDLGNVACNVFTADACRYRVARPLRLLQGLRKTKSYQEGLDIVISMSGGRFPTQAAV